MKRRKKDTEEENKQHPMYRSFFAECDIIIYEGMLENLSCVPEELRQIMKPRAIIPQQLRNKVCSPYSIFPSD